MAEALTIGGFLAGLTFCIITGNEVLYALLFGVFCFSSYALYKGVMPGNVMRMLGEGMYRVFNILVIFIFIGCMTALWRISGTIPFILYYSVGWIQPQFFVLCTFLLCSMMSFLTGTSFGTVSTMGVICMMISNTAGLDPLLTAGAILSGIFFGDRCSPMSSSALLVCSLTKTDIYGNVRNMMRSSVVPFLISCVLYVVLSKNAEGMEPDMTTVALFEEYFSLHWVTVLPALLIFVLAFLHVDVKIAMGISILTAAVIALTIQGSSFTELLTTMWRGARFGEGSQMAELLNGGGIMSMVKVAAIVMILTNQICEGIYDRNEDLALALENTVIVIAALIPWSIAGSVPVMTVGSDSRCLWFAFYLYLLPIWNLLKSYLLRIFSTNSVRIS